MAPESESIADESLLVELLARAMAQRDRGEAVDLASICGERTALLQPLRAAIVAQDRLDEARDAAIAPEPMPDPMLGRTIGGRYEVARRLGMGAMGSVFAAFDRSLQRFVAIKVVEPWLRDESESAARFLREAQAIATLRHPSIVTVHDHGDGELPYLVMDLVPGLDLETVIDRATEVEDRSRSEAIVAAFVGEEQREARAQPRVFEAHALAPDLQALRAPWPVLCARIALPLARALEHAHDHGVLHRDVKPSNVRLEPDGGVVLLDFGLARIVGSGSLTREGSMLGTLAYMAPEQVRGERAATSTRTDVYGLGATLYHLLTLRPPFTGDAEALMQQILWRDPLPVRKLAPDVPRDLAAICHKAIEKRLGDRYPSAAAMATDLEAFLEHRPIVASPPGVLGRAWRRVRRHPARAVAMATTGVALPLVLLVAQFVSVRAAAGRRERANAARQAVPALATLEGRNPAYSIPEYRARNAPAQAATFARVARVLEADADDLEAQAMAAMLLLDLGEVGRGLEHLRALARGCGNSAMARAMVETVAQPGFTAAADWPARLVAALPSPKSADDGYVSAYLKLRAVQYAAGLRDVQRALELEPRHAAALHLLPLAWLGVSDHGKAMDAAIRVEGLLGRPTARTRYVIATERLDRGRHREACAALEQSLDLCPEQNGALNNLTVCLLELGQLDRAGASVDRALAARGDAVPTWRNKIKVLAARGQDQALDALVARLDAEVGRRWWSDLELGEIAFHQAVRAPEDRRPALARKAVDLLSRAIAGMSAAGVGDAAAVELYEVAGLLTDGRDADAARAMLRAMAGRARQPSTVADSAALFLRAGDRGVGLYLLQEANAAVPENLPIAAALIDELLRDDDRTLLRAAAAAWRAGFAGSEHPIAAALHRKITDAAIESFGADGADRVLGLDFRTLLVNAPVGDAAHVPNLSGIESIPKGKSR